MTIRDEMIAAPLEKRNAELEAANQELREKGQALLDAWADLFRPPFMTIKIKDLYATAGAADALRKVIADTQANLKKEEILNV